MPTQPVIIIPHLSFSSDCEEAIRAYIAAFGGEVHWLSRWSADSRDVTPAQIGKVMHAEFTLGSTRFAASDNPTTASGPVKLMVRMDNLAQARQAIALLAEGGEILSPLKPHPAPDDGGCGSVTRDRFGVTWVITCPNPAYEEAHP